MVTRENDITRQLSRSPNPSQLQKLLLARDLVARLGGMESARKALARLEAERAANAGPGVTPIPVSVPVAE